MQTSPPARTESLPLDQRQRLLLRLLRATPDRRLTRTVSRLHPADVAPLFPLLKPEEKLNLLEVLFEMGRAGQTLSELDDETLRRVLDDFPDNRLAVVLGRIPADDAVDILDQLDDERRQTLMGSLDPTLASHLNNLMLFGESTAGGIMDPDVVAFLADRTVEDTVQTIRGLAKDRRLFYLYVTDERGHLLGLVRLWQLLTARGDQNLREIMDRGLISVRVDTPQEEVARVFARYDLPIMPVLDEDGILVGIITVDDVIDVIEEELSEDLYRLSGLSQPESLSTPLHRSLRLRLPWLGLGLLGACLAALVIAGFQDVIARYAVIVAFMHVIGAAGGDTGRQILTVITASLATGEIDLWRPWKVVGRQCLLGLLCGLATGSVLMIIALVLEKDPLLAMAVLIAQTANQTMVALVATITPLVLQRLDRDPTLGTSTLIVATADIVGFATFLGLMTILT